MRCLYLCALSRIHSQRLTQTTNGKMRKIRMFCYETDDVKSLSYRLNSLINVCVQKSVFLRQTSWNHSLSEMDNSFQYTHIFMIRCFFVQKQLLSNGDCPYIFQNSSKNNTKACSTVIYIAYDCWLCV